MKEREKIRLLLVSSLKGAPLVLLLMLAGFFFARKVINYFPEEYEATTKIKLDDNRSGISAANLYKDFDVFNQFDSDCCGRTSLTIQ